MRRNKTPLLWCARKRSSSVYHVKKWMLEGYAVVPSAGTRACLFVGKDYRKIWVQLRLNLQLTKGYTGIRSNHIQLCNELWITDINNLHMHDTIFPTLLPCFIAPLEGARLIFHGSSVRKMGCLPCNKLRKYLFCITIWSCIIVCRVLLAMSEGVYPASLPRHYHPLH